MKQSIDIRYIAFGILKGFYNNNFSPWFDGSEEHHRMIETTFKWIVNDME